MHFKASGMQALGHAGFIASRGFEPDGQRPQSGQALRQLGERLRSSAATPGFASGMGMNVQMRLGNVDANEEGVVYHDLAPRLVVRATARSTVRGQREQTGPCSSSAVTNQPDKTAS